MFLDHGPRPTNDTSELQKELLTKENEIIRLQSDLEKLQQSQAATTSSDPAPAQGK